MYDSMTPVLSEITFQLLFLLYFTCLFDFSLARSAQLVGLILTDV